MPYVTANGSAVGSNVPGYALLVRIGSFEQCSVWGGGVEGGGGACVHGVVCYA